MLKGTGIAVSTPVQVAVGALILGKAVLIADLMPMINRCPCKPLIYNVAWKTTIYMVVASLLHYFELFDFWKATGSFTGANEKMLAEMVWPHLWAIQIVLLVLIFNYVVMHELARVAGRGKMREIFFAVRARRSADRGERVRCDVVAPRVTGA